MSGAKTVRALAATVLALGALTAPAAAQTLEAPFAGPYTLSDISARRRASRRTSAA